MKICNECETVAHCAKHGCVPKVSAKDAITQAINALNCIEYGSFCINDGPSKDTTESAITALREALAEQPAQHDVDWEKLYRLEVKKKEALAAKYERDTGKKLTRIVPMAEQPAQDDPDLQDKDPELVEQPEFIRHEVENADDWSEWVCPDPKGYLMKCCDCGLVHEAEFGVVRYKSETEREECDMVDDPNLQAVFRMRRSEQWTPKDTAYRPGGLAQPKQEPVAWMDRYGELYKSVERVLPTDTPLFTSAPSQRTWVGLTEDEIDALWLQHDFIRAHDRKRRAFARAIEAAHGIKENT